MRAGTLRHQVTLQSLGERIDDSAGGGSIPPVDEATVWADIHPLAGNELLRAGQFDATLTHRISIRYLPGIRPSWRVKYGTRLFDIKSVADIDERHREIEMMCTEFVTW